MARIAGIVVLVLVVGIAVGWFAIYRPWDSKADQFAADRAPPEVKPIPFDAKRALRYLEQICRIGPRISGSDGMKEQQELLKKHFEAHGGTVTFQRFQARQDSRPAPVEMANLIVTWHPDRDRRIILCCHYDTRPIADQEPNPRDWTRPFVSANDGGSGVAWLMEMAHHMKDLPTEVGIDFVIFDGEEYIYDPDGDRYFIGSDHFADTYRKEQPQHRYVAGILLDMIAGKSPRFPIEQYSWAQAGRLVQEIWSLAQQLRLPSFQNRMGPAVRDDHLALNRVGIPTIDIIDFDYRHWHRLSDIPANCSTEGMEQVAVLLTTWLQQVR